MTPAASAADAVTAGALADAFDREVAERLPRLLAAAKAITGDDEPAAQAAVAVLRHEAHTLASSAALVGATAAALAGRECERLLLPYDAEDVPRDVALKAGALARGMVRALARRTRA